MAIVDSEMVIAPGGVRRRHLVKKLGASNLIGHRGPHRLELDGRGAVVRRLGRALTASGKGPLFPRSIRQPASVAGMLGAGWIAYAEWRNDSGSPVSLFRATWTVPPAPLTQSGQSVMYFNGIQSDTYILQPVLQWGETALGGGNYWAVASWLAARPHVVAHRSPQLVPVQTGQVLEGVISLVDGTSPGPYSYNCQFVGLGGTSLDVQGIDELTVCVATLEAYQITAGSDYPGGGVNTQMTGIQIQSNGVDCTLDWQTTDAVVDCGQHADLISNASPSGEIDLVS